MEKQNTNEEKETFILDICHTMIQNSEYEKLLDLIRGLQDDWEGLTTVRLTKIIKRVFEFVPISYKSYEGVLGFLDGLIVWAENKKMLRLDLQCKQIHVLLNIGKYTECLDKIHEVSKDLKKYDDRTNLISLYVYESRAYYELKDSGRARASLTSARALAVSAACSAGLQAQIDLLNGMYLSDEHAYDMAGSYLIEALEGFVQDGAYDNARIALRYIILNKIMANNSDEIPGVLESKFAKKVKSDEYVEVLLKISAAYKKRDLLAYKEILSADGGLLETDSYIHRHLQHLYEVLLDRNVLKIIEPYSHIKIGFIAARLGLEEGLIEDKLRKMILDKAINGILDHATQCLILYSESQSKKTALADSIATMERFFESIQ